jgi:hypothetical protein
MNIFQLSPNPKENIWALLLHVKPFHWPHENYGPKIVCHHFLPGVIPICQLSVCDPALDILNEVHQSNPLVD